MEILRSRNAFSPIGSNLSRTDRVLYIFDKIKDSFTEIVLRNQNSQWNAGSDHKRNTDTLQDFRKTHHASQRTEKFDITSSQHSKNKQNGQKQRSSASHKEKTDSRNSSFPDAKNKSHKHREQDPSIINLCRPKIHDHCGTGNHYGKKVTKIIQHHLTF